MGVHTKDFTVLYNIIYKPWDFSIYILLMNLNYSPALQLGTGVLWVQIVDVLDVNITGEHQWVLFSIKIYNLLKRQIQNQLYQYDTINNKTVYSGGQKYGNFSFISIILF